MENNNYNTEHMNFNNEVPEKNVQHYGNVIPEEANIQVDKSNKKGKKDKIVYICIASIIAIINIIYAGNMDFEIERILANKGIIKPNYTEYSLTELPYSVENDEEEKEYVEQYIEAKGTISMISETTFGLVPSDGRGHTSPRLWCNFTEEDLKGAGFEVEEGDTVIVKGLITGIYHGSQLDLHNVELIEKGDGDYNAYEDMMNHNNEIQENLDKKFEQIYGSQE